MARKSVCSIGTEEKAFRKGNCKYKGINLQFPPTVTILVESECVCNCSVSVSVKNTYKVTSEQLFICIRWGVNYFQKSSPGIHFIHMSNSSKTDLWSTINKKMFTSLWGGCLKNFFKNKSSEIHLLNIVFNNSSKIHLLHMFFK